MKKLNTLLKAVFAVLFAGLVSLNVVVDRAMAIGGFSQNCQDIVLEGPFLSATCKKADGYTLQNTSIYLDRYIGNLDGTLSWGYYSFSDTCEAVRLGQSLSNRHYTLKAQCKKEGFDIDDNYISTEIDTEIDLDAHIGNIDGELTFED